MRGKTIYISKIKYNLHISEKPITFQFKDHVI